METMRKSWTDDRLDEFALRVDQRFDAVDKRFDAVDQRFEAVERNMAAGFERVDGEIRDLRSEMNARFDALNRTLIRTGAAMVVALLGLLATQL